MMKYLQVSIALLISTFFLTGCPKKTPNPTPEDTILGPGQERVDYVITTDAYSGDDAGFLVRRPNEDFTAEQNQVRNLLPSVYFDFDQALIPPGERDKLNQAAQHMMENPSDRLLIEGHCDWRGTVEYNIALGDRRANSVRLYLETLGVDPVRMEINSKGKLEAIENGTEDQMAEDRRAELVIVR